MSLKASLKSEKSTNVVTTQSREDNVPLPTRTMIENRNKVALHDSLKYHLTMQPIGKGVSRTAELRKINIDLLTFQETPTPIYTVTA